MDPNAQSGTTIYIKGDGKGLEDVIQHLEKRLDDLRDKAGGISIGGGAGGSASTAQGSSSAAGNVGHSAGSSGSNRGGGPTNIQRPPEFNQSVSGPMVNALSSTVDATRSGPRPPQAQVRNSNPGPPLQFHGTPGGAAEVSAQASAPASASPDDFRIVARTSPSGAQWQQYQGPGGRFVSQQQYAAGLAQAIVQPHLRQTGQPSPHEGLPGYMAPEEFAALQQNAQVQMVSKGMRDRLGQEIQIDRSAVRADRGYRQQQQHEIQEQRYDDREEADRQRYDERQGSAMYKAQQSAARRADQGYKQQHVHEIKEAHYDAMEEKRAQAVMAREAHLDAALNDAPAMNIRSGRILNDPAGTFTAWQPLLNQQRQAATAMQLANQSAGSATTPLTGGASILGLGGAGRRGTIPLTGGASILGGGATAQLAAYAASAGAGPPPPVPPGGGWAGYAPPTPPAAVYGPPAPGSALTPASAASSVGATSTASDPFKDFLNSDLGKYGMRAGKGIAYGVGNSAAEYFHVKSQEELTGKRDDMAQGNIAGMLLGGIAGALIGSLFPGGYGGIIGASVGSSLGQQGANALLAPIVGPANRALSNDAIGTALGYNIPALEATDKRITGDAWKSNLRGPLAGVRDWAHAGARGGDPVSGTIAATIDWVDRMSDPNAPYAADQEDVEATRQQIASLGLRGGEQYSQEQLDSFINTDKRENQRRVNFAKRIAIQPSVGYNSTSAFYAMGPEDYFKSFGSNPLGEDQRADMLSHYKGALSGQYEAAGLGARTARAQSDLQTNLQSNLSISTQQDEVAKVQAGLRAEQEKWIEIARHYRETAPDGANSKEYLVASAQAASYGPQIRASERMNTEAYHGEGAANVAVGYAQASGVVQRATLTGNDQSLGALTPVLQGALRAEIANELEYKRRLESGGATTAEVTRQQAKIDELGVKLSAIPYEQAAAQMQRFMQQQGAGSAQLGVGEARALLAGTDADMEANYVQRRVQRRATMQGIRQRYSGLSSEGKLAADVSYASEEQGELSDYYQEGSRLYSKAEARDTLTMHGLSNEGYQAVQYGSATDIARSFARQQSQRESRIAHIRDIRPRLSVDDQIRADNEILNQEQQGREAHIAERSLSIGRQEDVYGLSQGKASNVLAEASRKSGVGGYREAVGGLVGEYGSERGYVQGELDRGDLTYDQRQALLRKKQSLDASIDSAQWEGLERGIGMRRSIASNQVRGSGAAELAAVTAAGQEYAGAGVSGDSPIFADLNTQRRSAQMKAFHQKDLLSFGIPMNMLDTEESLRQSLPFNPGSNLALSMRRMQTRAPYIQERIGRYQALMAHGDLSEEEQAQEIAEINSQRSAYAQDIGRIAQGGANRIAALSAGAPSYRGRADSLTLAQTALMGTGHPRQDLGFRNGNHLQQSQNWFNQFAVPGFDPHVATSPVSRNSSVNSDLTLHSIDQGIKALIQLMSRSGGGGTGNPVGGMQVSEARNQAAGLLALGGNNRSGFGRAG